MRKQEITDKIAKDEERIADLKYDNEQIDNEIIELEDNIEELNNKLKEIESTQTKLDDALNVYDGGSE